MFGYDADVVNIWAEVGQNRLTDHANSLVGDLGQLRRESGTADRPIIFVVHSMGGLLVQKALNISESSGDNYLSSIYSSTFAIAFLGTPHRGSGLAFWGSLGTKFLKPVKKTNNALVKVLRERSEMLDNIQRDFHVLIRNRENGPFRMQRNLPYAVKMCCFYEELRLKGVGKVVERDSACLDGWPHYAIHANHMAMSRFTDKDDTGFKLVHGQLWGWVDDLKKLSAPTTTATPIPNATGLEGGTSSEIIIQNNGEFVGGDKNAVTELLLGLLDLPVEQRHVRIRAIPLDNPDYRLNNLGDYRRLRSAVKSYELALNHFIRGGVQYYWKWEENHLIEAVVELRSLALRGIKEYESWYVWPQGVPGRAVEVQFTREDVDSVSSGYYRLDETTGKNVQDTPQDEPLWLKEVFPRLVWERVAPAIALRAVNEQPDSPQAINIDDWVLSDREPDKLEQSTPTKAISGYQPPPWTW
ncbi:hypothetical protein LTR97_004217 [Elasticomyces elasticus]|uniref:DUF676 domain-containing protein n=1 Tax=Elasticomyces elasticus TaxID=574655 RepID=A0AAN7W900_9PEZI|nr:hypothetical protein LTR97_004217 [Elasticomyces elasticus]